MDMDTNCTSRKKASPFLLKLFYRTGAFHRPDEFSHYVLPPHIDIHTWPTATLEELSHHIADHSHQNQKLLPEPSIGTRLAFRLVYRDSNSRTPHQYVVKDLGSLVLGGEDLGDPKVDENNIICDMIRDEWPLPESADAHKTLSDAKFIVGDYLSCAILPPLEDGSIAPADSARSGRGSGIGEARWDDGPAPGRSSNSYGSQHLHGSGRGYRYGGVGYFGRGERPHGGSGGGGLFPMGEWRRGEKLPEVPGAVRSRGGWSRENGRYP